MINEVTSELRKKAIQKSFLEMEGCRFLEMWLNQNPDGSLPPLQIIEAVISVLDSLPITQEVLGSCDIARSLANHATSQELPSDLVSRATKLLQKW